MPPAAARAAAMTLGAALWVQVVLLPAAGAPGGLGSVQPAVWALASATLAALAASIALPSDRSRWARPSLLLAVFPTALGITALMSARVSAARFDVFSRSIAGATALGFVGAAIAWSDELAPAMQVTITIMDRPPSRPSAPPWRNAVMASLVALAAFTTIVGPAILAGRSPAGRIERIGGEPLARAREGLTGASGLGIALLLLLVAGSTAVRGKSPPRRGGARALAFGTWAFAAVGLYYLLERLR